MTLIGSSMQKTKYIIVIREHIIDKIKTEHGTYVFLAVLKEQNGNLVMMFQYGDNDEDKTTGN